MKINTAQRGIERTNKRKKSIQLQLQLWNANGATVAAKDSNKTRLHASRTVTAAAYIAISALRIEFLLLCVTCWSTAVAATVAVVNRGNTHAAHTTRLTICYIIIIIIDVVVHTTCWCGAAVEVVMVAFTVVGRCEWDMPDFEWQSNTTTFICKVCLAIVRRRNNNGKRYW